VGEAARVTKLRATVDKTGQERRACICCGRRDRKITGEHLLGDWLTELVGPGEYVAIRTAEGLPNQKREHSWRTDKVAEITINNVCDGCNHALSDIESGAKRVIAPLIFGEHRTLSPDDQRALALWLFKVATLYRYASQPRRDATREELDDLFVRRRPSDGTHVYVAMYVGRFHIKLISYQLGLVSAMAGIDFLRKLARREWDKGELVTLAVGHFVAQIALYPRQSSFTHGPSGSLVRRIWPTIGPVDWPPPMFVNDDGLESLAVTALS
jgi:hypothetical protein